MTRSSLLLLLLAAPALGARKAAVPPPERLLSLALAPSAAYRAAGRAQYFPREGKPKSQALTAAAAPGGRYRLEYAPSARKPPALILSSDGRTRRLLHVRPGLLWSGPAADDAASYGKTLTELYELSSSTGGVVAKRSTWRLDFRERKGGALRRSWWLDRKTGAVLRREQYRADGRLWRRLRFSRFAEGDPGEAAFAAPSGTAAPWTPPGGPAWRPDGFVPAEYRRREDSARVYGYGDGLASLTLTRGGSPAGAVRPPGLSAGPEGLGYGWACGPEQCYLEGDVLEDELLRAAASVGAQ